MRLRAGLVLAMLLLACGAASAHRLDELLQATLLTVESDHVTGTMRLIPGVAVAQGVIAKIDRDGDGSLSAEEQRAYAQGVVDALTLTVDGQRLRPRLVAATFPPVAAMREGTGEIDVEWRAEFPVRAGSRRLLLASGNPDPKAAYLVNSLMPADPAIHIVAQRRNETQSVYEVDYTQAGADAASDWFGGLQAAVSGASFGSLFRLGMRHIAEGTDHLLFLLVLLLPAPLLAVGTRWEGVAAVGGSVGRILRIVTAFTVGHSVTLGLAAWGVVKVPEAPVEVLIAVSILVSAVHALRPIFPGREAAIAGFFGLIHGLAFASTLSQLGLERWERVLGILAFNLGIETMQMVVVALTLPSLVLLSRTRGYAWVRVGGAAFAGVAAAGWVVERTLGLASAVDVVVNRVAAHAGWLAVGLLLFSLGCRMVRRIEMPEGGAIGLES